MDRRDRLDSFLFDPLRVFQELIHGIFALIGLWIFLLFFFLKTEPQASPQAFWTVWAILIPFWFVGVVKWTKGWFKQFFSFKDMPALCMTIGGPIISAAVIAIRIHKIR